MNKETRIQKIAQVIERDKAKPYSSQDILWKDILAPMPVYKIPLEYLIYNKYNGRILSRTKSLESQGHKIDSESVEGKKLIERLLMESNLGRNKQTLESIDSIGQEKVGIITRDGIIIDGNRRAMLLRRSGKYDFFKTVVLDVTLEEDPIGIEKLETMFQMGEDEKLDYNAIEKYLKAKGLKQRGISVEDISKWMGKEKTDVEEYLAVMETMDDYLDYLSYNNMYTQLDNREDQFKHLTKWLENFYGEESSKPFDGYEDSDVDELKMISYDYIRAVYEGKDFRNIADGLRDKHVFGNKQIWQSFRDYHFKNIKPIQDSEDKIDFNSDNLEQYLNDRDAKFLEKTINKEGDSFLKENLENHKQKIQNIKYANEPFKLASDAFESLDTIKPKNPAFSKIEVVKKIEEISKKVDSMLKYSPNEAFSRVVKILESIELENSKDLDKNKILESIKSIEKISYQIEKRIKSL